ncbi:pentapeptide repeat-containing protein [Streptomyces sp. NPDC091371]|uniref:pentapeptide repeat-containing protein n=1 Tax=Streptomyces sp. NPDC091371 TaxID=3155303 RepID=UPI00342651E5
MRGRLRRQVEQRSTICGPGRRADWPDASSPPGAPDFHLRRHPPRWRHSKFEAVVFEACNLTQADFQFAELRDVLFSHCDLIGVQFGNVAMQRVGFEDCTMVDVGGAVHMKGSCVQGPGALDLALALARDAGIKLEL